MEPHHHHCAGMHHAIKKAVTFVAGPESCSTNAQLAPLILAGSVLLMSFIVRLARFYSNRSAAANGNANKYTIPNFAFETFAMLIFCVPKMLVLNTAFMAPNDEKALSMWRNLSFDSAGAFWFIGYIAALETLDFVAMRHTMRKYRIFKNMAACEVCDGAAARTAALKPNKIEGEDETTMPLMDEKMTVYEAAALPPPPQPTNTQQATSCRAATRLTALKQTLTHIVARKYRVGSLYSITASYNLSIFLRTLMLYTTLSVATLSLCDSIPESYLDMRVCGLLQWMAIATIYAGRIAQLSISKRRFVERETAAEGEGALRLV